MRASAGNLFDEFASPADDEKITELVSAPGVRIERIVSAGHASPPGFWYDQAWAEWVTILAGSAAVLFEGEAEPHEMNPGDHILIPSHRRHRVTRTDPDRPTIWLGVHFAD